MTSTDGEKCPKTTCFKNQNFRDAFARCELDVDAHFLEISYVDVLLTALHSCECMEQ